jgi:hypothetical protein
MVPSILFKLASMGAALAVIFQFAPREPEWQLHEEPVEALGATSSDVSKGDADRVVRFLGGDGSTVLTGRLFLPVSTSSSSAPLSAPPPVIVLAHGLGLTQDCSLYL